MSYQKLPLVSVVIPTYNRIRTLPVSVNSVLNQTYMNLEIIIMDDGSTDGTKEYVESIADERIRYRRSEANMGPSAARNMGAGMAKGEYLAFQDSDDEWMPDKLEKQMKLMLDSKDVSLVYCEFGIYRDGELLAIIPSRKVPLKEKQGNLFSYLLLYPLISTQTMVIKTEEFLAEGCFNESLKAYEDFEFTLRFSKTHKIGFLPEALVKVNSLPGSVSKRFEERIHAQFYMVREMLTDLRKRNLLWEKLKIISGETKSLLCHDVFIEEINCLTEELLSEEEYQNAAVLLEEIEQSRVNNLQKLSIRENLQKLKQKILQIYENLLENRMVWSDELKEVLKQITGSVEIVKTLFAIPAEVQERYAMINKSLETDSLSEEDRLYLLADIVELFETLEKLW